MTDGRATNKTVPTAADVEAFLDAVPEETRRADARTLVTLMRRVTGLEPVLWGSIVGFGTYHYRYPTGREGDMPAASFAPRRAATTVYLMDGLDLHREARDRLGPHSVGKGCLYVKRLADVDLTVLEEMVRQAYVALVEGDAPYHQGERGSGKRGSGGGSG